MRIRKYILYKVVGIVRGISKLWISVIYYYIEKELKIF